MISQLAADTKPPTPQAGKASLSGVLYSYGLNRIIPETAFYIAPAMEDNGKYLVPPLIFGPRPEKGDVVGTSNKQGQVFLDDIPPGHYYMYIWTVYNWPMALESKEAEYPLLIEVEAGDQLDLGLLYVEWP
ncbi:MAG: hypothetical protein IPK16_21535 [Anaerolineales bacterium]|nr:hypothetical protein [Anaerolineales bacterium]